MFRKKNKNRTTRLAFNAALQTGLEIKERQFCNYLQKRTLHWDRRKKIIMLALVILFFGAFYTTILVSVIRHEHKQRNNFLENSHARTDSSLLLIRPKHQATGNNQALIPP